MKRFFDLILVLVAFCLLALPILLVLLAVLLSSRGQVLYWSDRVGIHNKIFRMPKFRTMVVGTPAVATHLLNDPNAYLTPIGAFLRKSSLDELPQLWSILIGDMSFVGPRPALFNQDDLIALRTAIRSFNLCLCASMGRTNIICLPFAGSTVSSNSNQTSLARIVCTGSSSSSSSRG